MIKLVDQMKGLPKVESYEIVSKLVSGIRN